MIRFMILAGLFGLATITAAQQDRRSALDQAYEEVLAARKNLQEAQARQQAGVEPLPGERLGIVGGGSRLSPDYFARQDQLRKDVREARNRLDEAYRRWNEFR